MTDTPDIDAPEDDITVHYDGVDWTVPPSFDNLSIDGVEAWARFAELARTGDASAPAFHLLAKLLGELLGASQWARFKRGRTAKDANGLLDAIFAAYGEKHRGE